MSPQLPSFLRRRLRLSDARKALLAGEPEAALANLDDPCLQDVPEAAQLRERVLDALCRCASRCLEEGEFAESERLLHLVAPHDPRLARAWRRRLALESEGSQISHVSGVRRAAESGIIGAMEGLLGRMRETRGSTRILPVEATSPSADLRRRSNSTLPNAEASLDCDTFLLAVDDIGEFLVSTAGEVTIGHARAMQADLPILADLDPHHVRLVCTESFHSGPGWRIEATRAQPVAIGGELIDPGGASLIDGDEVQVSPNVSFLFRRPEAASGSAILEFLHGVECRGALRVLLFAPGRAGRVRIGNRPGRHMVARRAKEEISLWLEEGAMVIESAAKLRVDGTELAIQPVSETGPGGLRLPCPPSSRVSITVGQGGEQGPPFGFSLRPVEVEATRGSGQ